MLCSCGGILDVIWIEEPPKELKRHRKLIYNRVCDVECLSCGKKYFSQPYDFGMSTINLVKKGTKEENK